MSHTLTLEAITEHGAFVRRLAHGLLRDDDAADDVVQDTWLAFLRRPPSAAANAKSWLASVVMNRVRNSHRATQHRAEREALAARAEPVDAASASAERLELQQCVVAAVLALPEHTRKVVLLVYHEGLSTVEAARRLGLPPGTARSQLSRGIAELRAKLDKHYHGGRAAWSAALLHLVHGSAKAGGAAYFALALTATGVAGATAAWLSTTPAPIDTLAPAAPAVAAAPSVTDGPRPSAGLPERLTRHPVPATGDLDSAISQDGVRPEPDLTKLSIAELGDLAAWAQHYLRRRLLVAEPDEVGAELALLRHVRDHGATRILRNSRFDTAGNEPLGIRGGGSYYSFVTLSHSYDDQPDLGLSAREFRSGFHGGSVGYLLDLGDHPLASLSQQPPATLGANARDAYVHMWSAAIDDKGLATVGFRDRASALGLTNSADALTGHTYLVRSIPDSEHDVLVAFRSVTADDTGHTLVWRVLHRFALSREPINSMPKAPTGKAPSWLAAMSGQELLDALDRLRGQAEPRLLAVPEALLRAHAANATGKGRGLCRILERGRFPALTKTRGDCAYYNFVRKTHDYNARPQVSLGQGGFSSGFVGNDQGLVVDLGDVPLDTAELADQQRDAWTRDAVTFLVDLAPERRDGGDFAMSAPNRETASQRGYTRAEAKADHTYLLRSVQDREDLLVAFRVLEVDGDGATLLWRVIRRS